jgi:IS1 family transposase
MNRLTKERRVSVIGALCEGCSINSIVLMTGVSKPTILKLLLDLGRACLNHEDEALRGLFCERIEADEIWGFNHCKERWVKYAKAKVDGAGSVWTWYAVDAKSKLLISWVMGDRDAGHAAAFMDDLAGRLASRPMLTTDALGVYADAVFDAFSRLGVDYAQVHKSYERLPDDERTYSPPRCTACEKRSVFGSPNTALAGTSYIERANLTLRMSQRRWTRLTNAHSKSFKHMEAAFALHSCYYNWARKHATIGTTPAVAAGVADRPWTTADIVGLLEAQEARENSED